MRAVSPGITYAGVNLTSPVGYTPLRMEVSRQIAKDVELMNTGQVNGVTWHFFQSPATGVGGPSQPLLNMLRQSGIGIINH